MTQALNLIAFDRDDLTVLSSLLQDGVTALADMHYDAETGRFIVMLNRYKWEEKRRFWRPRGSRVRAVLQINQVRAIQRKLIDDAKPQGLMTLLALDADAEANHLTLQFSGGGAIRLSVDSLDLIFKDIGDSYDAVRRPNHDSAPS